MNQEQIKKIKNLIHLDYDSVTAYNDAIDKIEDVRIKNVITNYRNDHQVHIRLFNDILEQVGHRPINSTDFEGYLVDTFVRIGPLAGTIGVLEALELNEQLVKRHYEDALDSLINTDYYNLVKCCYEDELRHQEYIATFLLRLRSEKKTA